VTIYLPSKNPIISTFIKYFLKRNQLTYLFFIIRKITLFNVNKCFYPTFLLYSKQNDFKRDNGLFFETIVNLFSLLIKKNSTSMCCFSQVHIIYDTIYLCALNRVKYLTQLSCAFIDRLLSEWDKFMKP
jgi:hypothetical protein